MGTTLCQRTDLQARRSGLWKGRGKFIMGPQHFRDSAAEIVSFVPGRRGCMALIFLVTVY
jgi:hypothetical protein